MGFKTVKGGSLGRKLSDLNLGESVEGYLLGTAESKFSFSIKLLNAETNQVETFYPSGNLSYLEQDIEEGTIALNVLTRITRTGTRTSTKAMDPDTKDWRQVPVYKVDQDAEAVVSESDAASALAADIAATEAALATAKPAATKSSRR